MDATRTQELAAEEEAERQRKRAREKEAWRAQRERSAKKTAALQGHDEAWGRARVAHVGRAHSVAGALDAHIERHWRPSGGAFAYYPEGLLRIPERFVAVHVSRVIPLLVHCVEAEFDYAYATTAFCDEFLGEGRYARRVAQLPAAPPSLPLLERLSSAVEDMERHLPRGPRLARYATDEEGRREGEGGGEEEGGEEGYGGGGMEGERKSKGERGQGTGRWHTRGGRVVGGDRRIPSYGGDYRYAREDKGVEVQLLLFESFGGFGKGVREILRKAADVLQNKLTRAQYLDEVTWTTKSWLGLQKQRISVVLHTAIAEQIVNELACGGGGRVHGA
ncbi:hypothetical protein EMIHUDRAFT_124514, partial [Emiliania huxleyi CCMP1516]|uniref:Uncharacterized protein n=2 Tax=Emiliania huxleyi TaxID=2903 RepID=A0A0D3IP19_EMIH1